MPEPHLIRDLRLEDRPDWQQLWERYLVFYETDLPADRTELLWRRIFDEDDPVSCIVAELDGTVVGIAHYFPHPDTWQDGPVCYLQDLYVAEPHRGSGIGRSLILEVQVRCRRSGWRLLHWQTKADNTPARDLYDSLTGGANGFIGYELEIPSS